jgi:hypothetical protein
MAVLVVEDAAEDKAQAAGPVVVVEVGGQVG